MKKKKFTNSDLDGFADICNETQLFAVNAGCATEDWGKEMGKEHNGEPKTEPAAPIVIVPVGQGGREGSK